MAEMKLEIRLAKKKYFVQIEHNEEGRHSGSEEQHRLRDRGRAKCRIMYWEENQEMGSNIAELDGNERYVVPCPYCSGKVN